MGYAIKPNGSYRAVDQNMPLELDETYAEQVPAISAEQKQAELIATFSELVEAWMNSVVAERGYGSLLAACSYSVSSVQQWKNEAMACIVWRDAVWNRCYELMAQFSSDENASSIPRNDDFLKMLPQIDWPK